MSAGPMNPCSKIKLTCSTFVLSLRINRCLKCLIWDDLFRSSSGSMNASHLLINTRYALYSFRPKASTGWKTSWWLLITSHGNEKNHKLFFSITKIRSCNNKNVNLRIIQWQDFRQIQNQNFPLVVLFYEFKFVVQIWVRIESFIKMIMIQWLLSFRKYLQEQEKSWFDNSWCCEENSWCCVEGQQGIENLSAHSEHTRCPHGKNAVHFRPT